MEEKDGERKDSKVGVENETKVEQMKENEVLDIEVKNKFGETEEATAGESKEGKVGPVKEVGDAEESKVRAMKEVGVADKNKVGAIQEIGDADESKVGAIKGVEKTNESNVGGIKEALETKEDLYSSESQLDIPGLFDGGEETVAEVQQAQMSTKTLLIGTACLAISMTANVLAAYSRQALGKEAFRGYQTYLNHKKNREFEATLRKKREEERKFQEHVKMKMRQTEEANNANFRSWSNRRASEESERRRAERAEREFEQDRRAREEMNNAYFRWSRFFRGGGASSGNSNSGTGRNSQNAYSNTTSYDPYAVLGIQRGISSSEVKRAYLNLAKQWHPDMVSPENAAQSSAKFQLISEAYDAIKRTLDEKKQPYR